MKKLLLTLSLMTAFAAGAQMGPLPASSEKRVDILPNTNTQSLNKSVVSEGEKTQDALKEGKITPGDAAKLDAHEANIARDISAAKADGRVSGNEKNIIKSEIKINQDLRDEMKDRLEAETKKQ